MVGNKPPSLKDRVREQILSGAFRKEIDHPLCEMSAREVMKIGISSSFNLERFVLNCGYRLPSIGF